MGLIHPTRGGDKYFDLLPAACGGVVHSNPLYWSKIRETAWQDGKYDLFLNFIWSREHEARQI